MDTIDKLGLILIDFTRYEHWTRAVQVVDQVADRPVPWRTCLRETFGTDFVTSPDQPVSTGPDDRDNGCLTASECKSRRLQSWDPD
jgi:hypothetical protein